MKKFFRLTRITCVLHQVEVQAEGLQQHDEWDATPLYYAAHAGNKDLVKYLLSVGAKCEEKVLAFVHFAQYLD